MGGTDAIATNEDVDIEDAYSVHQIIEKHHIQLLIVGPEAPLVAGIVDELNA